MTCQTHKYWSFLQNYYYGNTCLHWHWLTLNMKTVFLFGIWNDDRTKMIVLTSLHQAPRSNSQNANETEIINEISHINLFRNIRISIWHNWIFDSSKCCFLFYFSSVHDYWLPSTWNSLVHTSLCEMERCGKRAFQLLKLRLNKISLNIKTKSVTDFLLAVSSSSMRDYTFHYVVST